MGRTHVGFTPEIGQPLPNISFDLSTDRSLTGNFVLMNVTISNSSASPVLVSINPDGPEPSESLLFVVPSLDTFTVPEQLRFVGGCTFSRLSSQIVVMFTRKEL